MADKMTISAVIPAYNAEQYVTRAIQSVLAQTHPVDEIIVIDDGSTDGTAKAVRSFGDKVRLLQQPNAGVSAARNAGIKAATGEWIAFLDADDEWLPEKIERQVRVLRNNPDLAWVIANYDECLCEENRRAEQCSEDKIRQWLDGKEYFDSYFQAWRKCLWGCSDVQVIRRDVLIEAGLFPIGQKIAEDIDTWLRVAYLYPKVGFVAESTAIYHIGAAQSGQQPKDEKYLYANFVERHLKFADEAGVLESFQPAAVFLMQRWIRGMLFEGQKDEIRELLRRFPSYFTFPYSLLVYTLTMWPCLTVFMLRLISKIARGLKLRRRVTRKPSKPI